MQRSSNPDKTRRSPLKGISSLPLAVAGRVRRHLACGLAGLARMDLGGWLRLGFERSHSGEVAAEVYWVHAPSPEVDRRGSAPAQNGAGDPVLPGGPGDIQPINQR